MTVAKKKAPARKPAARKAASKGVKIVGVDKKTADQVKAAARAANEAEELTEKVQLVQKGSDTAEAGDTPRARRDKAQAMFEKADAAGRDAIIASTKRTTAALGGL